MIRTLVAVCAAAVIAPAACGQVTVTFPYSDQFGETPSDLGDIVFAFSVDGVGGVSLDVSTSNVKEGGDLATAESIVDLWDSASVGTTSVPSLFNTSFTLELDETGFGTSVSEVVVRSTDGGHLGIAGRNAGRIDNAGDEFMAFDAEGLNGVLTLESFDYGFASSINPHVIVSDGITTLDGDVQIRYDLTGTTGTVDVSADGFVVPDGESFRFQSDDTELELTAGTAIAGFTFELYGLGDLNLDGVEDQTDIDLFAAGWKLSSDDLNAGPRILQGDVNDDGTTDFADWYIIRESFAAGGAAVSFPATITPEPHAGLLLLVGALGGVRSRARRLPRS